MLIILFNVFLSDWFYNIFVCKFQLILILIKLNNKKTKKDFHSYSWVSSNCISKIKKKVINNEINLFIILIKRTNMLFSRIKVKVKIKKLKYKAFMHKVKIRKFLIIMSKTKNKILIQMIWPIIIKAQLNVKIGEKK